MIININEESIYNVIKLCIENNVNLTTKISITDLYRIIFLVYKSSIYFNMVDVT